MRCALYLAAVGVTLGTTPPTEPRADACADMTRVQPGTGSPPRALRATFLGVTTILLDDGETAIMTDGFFSRPSVSTVLKGHLTPNTARIDGALTKAGIKTTAGVRPLAAILTAHSHYDHAMDTPVVAGMTHARIVGSPSTRNIARGAGFPDSMFCVVSGGERLTLGHFQVKVIRSPHSEPYLFAGEIAESVTSPAHASDYREGGNFSFLIEHDGQRTLIHPSANFDTTALRGTQADVVFLGIGALGFKNETFMRKYWHEVVEQTGAKLVIPVHWDNFSRSLDKSLDALSLKPDSAIKAMRALRKLARESGVTVKLPEAFETIDLAAPHP
jgi:L-ascorbate metabolism protein UlaG (beta-lactamase superfamily)